MENMQMSKEDEEFMNKVMTVINANIEDETFNVERMAAELAHEPLQPAPQNQDALQHVAD